MKASCIGTLAHFELVPCNGQACYICLPLVMPLVYAHTFDLRVFLFLVFSLYRCVGGKHQSAGSCPPRCKLRTRNCRMCVSI